MVGVWTRARVCLPAFVAAMTLMAAGAAGAAEYIYDGLPDLKPEDRTVVARPQPVQLLFQFKSRGAPNARGTKYLKDEVVETVKTSGLFSEVDDGPTANGAVLSIEIDNVAPTTDIRDAEAKGFTTGLTLFVAGNNVVDHYACKVSYVAGPTAPTIDRSAEHAMITQIGLINKAPEHAVKVGSMKDAISVMTRQIISNPLNDLAKDPGFAGGRSPANPEPESGPSPTLTTESPPPATSLSVSPDGTVHLPPPPPRP